MYKNYMQKLCLMGSDICAMLFSLIIIKLFLVQFFHDSGYFVFHIIGAAKLIAMCIILVFWYQEQYSKRRPIWEELQLLCTTIAIFAIIHFSISYAISHHVIKMFNMLFWGALLVILPSMRVITKLILFRFGMWQRDLYIIGTDKSALSAFNKLKDDKLLGFNVLGFVAYNMEHVTMMPKPVILLDDLMHKTNVKDVEVIIAVELGGLSLYTQYINQLQVMYHSVSIIPDIADIPIYGIEINHFFGSEQLILRLTNNLATRLHRMVKRSFDIVLSIVILVIISPLFIVISVFLQVLYGKVFFLHKRVGIHGKQFYCIKFQTMYSNSQELLDNILACDYQARQEWQLSQKLKLDPRVTRIGRFLRRTSLDELPQLLNVLIGDMSLVGPRPIVQHECSKYGDDIYYYQLVRPGITGLWQISGRSNVDYTTRVSLDVWYVKNWSLWCDFVILLQTVRVVFTGSGAY
jgi:Undecaprenyl-phosphate galactose phosphotransferase WbaP